MIGLSLLLVVTAFAMLLLGVVGVGEEPLRFVYASIGFSLAAAVLLAIGVMRARPSRRGSALPRDAASRSSWSGAVDWGQQPSPPAAGSSSVSEAPPPGSERS